MKIKPTNLYNTCVDSFNKHIDKKGYKINPDEVGDYFAYFYSVVKEKKEPTDVTITKALKETFFDLERIGA